MVQKQLLSTGSGSTLCHAPERNNGKKWPEMDAKAGIYFYSLVDLANLKVVYRNKGGTDLN